MDWAWVCCCVSKKQCNWRLKKEFWRLVKTSRFERNVKLSSQAGGAGLQMPPWTGAGLPRRRIHARVGDCVATEPSVGFDGQSCCASLSAGDTRRSCIPCGSGSSVEQPTVTCHIIFIVGVFQAQPQDWAVPEIVRWSLISAVVPRHIFDFVTCPRSQHWFMSR